VIKTLTGFHCTSESIVPSTWWFQDFISTFLLWQFQFRISHDRLEHLLYLQNLEKDFKTAFKVLSDQNVSGLTNIFQFWSWSMLFYDFILTNKIIDDNIALNPRFLMMKLKICDIKSAYLRTRWFFKCFRNGWAFRVGIFWAFSYTFRDKLSTFKTAFKTLF